MHAGNSVHLNRARSKSSRTRICRSLPSNPLILIGHASCGFEICGTARLSTKNELFGVSHAFPSSASGVSKKYPLPRSTSRPNACAQGVSVHTAELDSVRRKLRREKPFTPLEGRRGQRRRRDLPGSAFPFS